jgi:hypothetical protein
MKIDIIKFGNILMSRPDGREAFLVIKSSFLSHIKNEKIILDFTKVDVVAPSWLDEVLTPIKETFGKDRIEIIPGHCSSLQLAINGIEY